MFSEWLKKFLNIRDGKDGLNGAAGANGRDGISADEVKALVQEGIVNALPMIRQGR